MISLKEITYEYVDALKYVKEIPRKFELPLHYPDIIAIIGPRRVGKTFTMLKTAKTLLNNGENVIYVSFDEPLLRKIDVREFAKLVRKEYPEGKVYLFLDEIQEWHNWDFNLRWLHDVKDFYIYISGSSSTLQSSEIPSRLRGRYISKVLLPLSFREIVNFEIKTFREKGKVLKLLEDYLKWGGFPEIWVYKSREKIITLLETIFYKDIVDRFKIRDIGVFEDIFYFILSNFSNRITWNSLKKLLEGINIKVDTKTIIKYVKYMELSFLLFIIQKFTYSEREKVISPKKIYLVDTCFTNLFEKPMDLGRKIENLVFLELMRKYQNSEIYYYQTKDKEEIDFLVKIKPNIVEIFEVTYEVDQEHIRKVKKALSELNLREATIITWDEEDIIEENGKKILIKPLWKWLLEN